MEEEEEEEHDAQIAHGLQNYDQMTEKWQRQNDQRYFVTGRFTGHEY